MKSSNHYLCLLSFAVVQFADPVRSATVIASGSPASQGSGSHLSNEVQEDQRPLYNIAHMCNSIKKTLTSLSRGANAVEVDVTFKPDDIYLYHGYPCDCFRYCWDIEPLSRYLTFARKITTPGNAEYNGDFVILYFDVKLNNFNEVVKHQQGIRFANYLERFFFEAPYRSTLKLVVSISYANDVDFLRALISRLQELNIYELIKPNIGFDVGMDADLSKIRHMWTRLNVSNVWQGEGITNCINPILDHKLDKLVHERNMPKSILKKVYRWTIDLSDSIKVALRHSIDGIMTNHPERVVSILREPEFGRSFRLATVNDNPFAKHTFFRGPNIPGKAQVNTSVGEKVITFLRDIRESAYYFVVELFHSLLK